MDDMAKIETKDKTLSFWLGKIEAYEKASSKWCERAGKIVDLYAAEEDSKTARYRILWSNVQTLLPAVYDKPPVPNITKRNNKRDPVGLAVSDVLERSVSYFVDDDSVSDLIESAVLDRLLAGRGTMWARYNPTFGQITDDEPEQVLAEDVLFDFVHYEDFGHTVAKTWPEVRAVWRRVFMDRAKLEERFGERGKLIPLDSCGLDESSREKSDMAAIYEIWDKRKRRVLWVSKSHPVVLDEQEDPLRITGFFPCPKPIYATISNKSLIPTPDYMQYQDQSAELDLLTGRIEALTKALKVAGVYDASAEGIQRLLSEGTDNKLIPVQNWAVMSEKGGMNGVMSFLPIDTISKVLEGCYRAREAIKQDLYEITGMSDVIRGATNPNETARAQEMKGQYASMRLGRTQKSIQYFCRDLVVIATEIICNLFSIETIKRISGVQLLTEAEKMMMGTDNGKPTWEQVEQVLKDDVLRSYSIRIETDSTIKADQEADKASRMDFLTAAGGFLREAAQVPVPELQPLMAKMLSFGVRGFKTGRDLENEFDNLIDRLEEKAKQPPQQPPPDPRIAMEQQKMQHEAQKGQAEMQMRSAEMQMQMQVLQAQAQIKQIDLEIKKIDLMMKQVEARAEVISNEQRVQNEVAGGQASLPRRGRKGSVL